MAQTRRFDGDSRAAAVLLTCVAMATADRPAQSSQLAWNNASGGNAATASNWTPSRVPLLTDFLVFGLNSTYTVNFGSGLPTTWNQRYRNGQVSVNFTSPHTMTGPLEVSACCGDSAKLIILSGDLTCQSSIEIGDGTTPKGTLELSGSDVSVTKQAGSAGQVIVSENGKGKVLILGGAVCDIAGGNATIGLNSGSQGTVLVSGFDLGPLRRSSFHVSGGSPSRLTVGSSGTGLLNLDQGGQTYCGNDLLLGEESTGSGTIEMHSDLFPSLLTVAGDLTLAKHGTGILHVREGATVTVGDELWLTDALGTGHGTLHVETGGTVITHGLVFEDNGDLDFEGGLIRVEGGTLTASAQTVTINSQIGSPVLEFTDGATGELSALASNFSALALGTSGIGTARILDHSSVAVTQGNLRMGSSAGTTGVLEVDGGGELTCVTLLQAGFVGSGLVTVSDGGSMTVPEFEIAVHSGSQGSLNVTGPGSIVTATWYLGVGARPSFSGGNATVHISDGATVSCPNSGTSVYNGWDGTISIDSGGSLTTAGNVDQRGSISISSGTMSAGSIVMTGSADLSGNGLIDSAVSSTVDCAITATGPLTVGRASDPQGIKLIGPLVVGSQSVQLLDADGPQLGNTSLNGGTLTYAGEGWISPGRSVSGNGLINGRLRSSVNNALAPSGAGLRFDGLFIQDGGTCSGTVLQFLDDGGFEGSGTLDCSVDFDPGSSATATGALTMGNPGATTGVTMDGDLYVGSHIVTLRDANSIGLGPLTSLGGGTLAHTSTLSLGAGNQLTGFGTIIAAALDNFGTVAPGPAIGEIAVNGAYRNQTGTLSIQLGDAATDECDRLAIQGAATWGGTLLLQPGASFNGHAGDTYTIATHSSRTGGFANVLLHGFPSGTTFDIGYGNSRLLARMTFNPAAVGDEPEIEPSLPTTLLLRPIDTFGDTPALELGLPRAGEVSLGLFDVSGRSVLSFLNGPVAAGWHRYELTRDARLSGGIYFGRVEVREASGRREGRTARILVVR